MKESSEVLECKPVRNRAGLVIKNYEGIPEVIILNLTLAFILITIFTFLRQPCDRLNVEQEHNANDLSFLYNKHEPHFEDDYMIGASAPELPKLPKSYLGWIKFVINLSDEEFLRTCGPDALHYLSFQKHLMVVIIIVTVICLIVILPINYSMGSNYNADRLGRTTMSNLPTNSKWLWVHITVVVCYLPLITFTMQDSSGNKAFETAVQVRTVWIKKIKPEHRSEDFIRSHLEKAFPKIGIEKVQLVYRYDHYLKYYKQYERIKSALEYLQENRTDFMVKPSFCSRRKVKATVYYLHEERKLVKILQELRLQLREQRTGMAFVTLSSQEGAKRLVKCFKRSSDVRWNISIAPQTADIVWENLVEKSPFWYLLWFVVNSALFATLCFLVTPAVVIDILIQRSKFDIEHISIRKILVANLMVCVFSYIMPHVVLYSDDILKYYTLSKNQFWVMVKIFFYLFVMLLILPTLGFISIQTFTEQVISGERLLWQCIFRPTRSDFYCKYIIAESLLLVSIDLLRLGDLVIYGWEIMTMKCKAEVPYIKKIVFRMFPYGKNYAWTIFIFTTAIVHSVFCPLIMPFTLLYILTKHFVDRYNIYFGFIPSNMVSYDGGKIHTVAINMTTCSIITLKLFMAMIFASVNDLLRAALCFIILIISLMLFPVLLAFRKNPKIPINISSKSLVYLPAPLQQAGVPIF